MQTKKIKNKGFTLIELVIVLAVLAIIALIAIPNFNKVRTDSQKKADDATCDTIERVTEMAIADKYFIRKTSGNKTIDITFNAKTGAMNDIKINTTEFDVSNDVNGSGENAQVAYKNLLSEVKKPQVKGQIKYRVTITDKDEVESVKTK